MSLDSLFTQVILLSMMGSILAIFILLIKNIFRKKLSGKVHYYIWFLLVLKLIIPLTFQSQLSPFNFTNDKSQKYDISSVVNKNITNLNTTNKLQQSTAQKINYKRPVTPSSGLGFNLKTAALVWIIGILLILSYIIFVNIILWINIKKRPICKRQDIDSVLHQCKLKLRVNSKISVIFDKDVKSPAVYGIIRPKILISQQIIDKLSLQELRFVLLHELSHIKRKDLILNVIIMLLQAIYWFNPLIVYSLYQFKQDCELACDTTAISALNSNEIKKYGETIINMLQILSKPNVLIGTLGFSNKYSKRRIIMISSFNKKSILGTVIALCLVLAVGCSSTVKCLSTNPNNTNASANTTNSNVSPSSNVTNTTSTNKQGNVTKQNITSANNSTPKNNNNNNPSQSSPKDQVDITAKVKNYIFNGQGNKPSSRNLNWSESFLNQVDIETLYKKYTANGGDSNNIESFAQYVTSNAPIPSNWQYLFKKDFSANNGKKVSRLEYLSSDLYQAYVVIDSKEVPFVVVSSRTGNYHG